MAPEPALEEHQVFCSRVHHQPQPAVPEPDQNQHASGADFERDSRLLGHLSPEDHLPGLIVDGQVAPAQNVQPDDGVDTYASLPLDEVEVARQGRHRLQMNRSERNIRNDHPLNTDVPGEDGQLLPDPLKLQLLHDP